MPKRRGVMRSRYSLPTFAGPQLVQRWESAGLYHAFHSGRSCSRQLASMVASPAMIPSRVVPAGGVLLAASRSKQRARTSADRAERRCHRTRVSRSCSSARARSTSPGSGRFRRGRGRDDPPPIVVVELAPNGNRDAGPRCGVTLGAAGDVDDRSRMISKGDEPEGDGKGRRLIGFDSQGVRAAEVRRDSGRCLDDESPLAVSRDLGVDLAELQIENMTPIVGLHDGQSTAPPRVGCRRCLR